MYKVIVQALANRLFLVRHTLRKLNIGRTLAFAWLLSLPAAGLAQHRIFETVNNAAAAAGHDNVKLAVVEWITASDEVGQTVFFNDRGNKQLSTHWVPNDPRNDIGFGLGTALAWGIDGVEVTSDVEPAEDLIAIAAAMQTWQEQNCSYIPLVDLGVSGFDYGFVQNLVGLSAEPPTDFGGTDFFFPILTHAGFLDGAFFDILTPDGSNLILAVTFTFIWIDGPEGLPTDIDGNGRLDTAFREIYYNDAFDWGDGTGGTIDMETVALHEAGHGLSQTHFGKLFRTDRNGRFHFAPRAVMNAGYTGVQRILRGTDNGGHCANWASWPNK